MFSGRLFYATLVDGCFRITMILYCFPDFGNMVSNRESGEQEKDE